MSALGSLVVKLALEYAEYTRGLDKSSQEALKFAQNQQRALDQAGRKVDDFFSGLARNVAIGIGAYVSLTSAVGKFTDSIDNLANLDDLSQKTGSAVENLSRMQKVATQFGGDWAAINPLLIKLAKGMASVDDATNSTHKALAALGVSSKDAAGKLRDPSEVMIEVAKRLQNYQDGAAKTALVNDLMGKSAADQLPYLNDLAEHFDEMNAASKEAAAQASVFKDELGGLKLKVNDLFEKVAIDALPVMIDFVDALADSGKNSRALATDSSLSSWAEDTARSMAVLVDEMAKLPKLALAVAKAAEAGYYASKLLNPMTAAGSLFTGGSPLQDFKRAMSEAEPVFDFSFGGPAFPTLDALDARLAARRNPADDTLARMEAAAGSRSKKPVLVYPSGTAPKDPKQKINNSYVSDVFDAAIGDLNREGVFADQAARVHEVVQQHIKDYQEQQDALRAYNDDWNKYLGSLQDSVDSLQKQNDQFGMTAVQIAEDNQLRAEERVQIAQTNGVAQSYIDQLQKEVELRKQIVSETQRGEHLAQIKKEQDLWKETWGNVERTAHDTFISIFDSGKSAFDRLRDALKNGLLDLLYQMTLKKWILNIGASVGGSGISGAALAAGEAGGILSGGSSGGGLGSIGSMISNGFSLVSGSLSETIAGMAGNIGGGIGQFLLGNSEFLGAAIPAIGLGIAALGLFGGGLFSGHISRPKEYANSLVTMSGTSTLATWTNSDGGAQGQAKSFGGSLGGYLSTLTKQLGGTIKDGFVLGTKYMQKYNSLQVSVGSGATKTSADGGVYLLDNKQHMELLGPRTFFIAVQRGFIQLDPYLKRFVDATKTMTDSKPTIDALPALIAMKKQLEYLPAVFDAVRDSLMNSVTIKTFDKLTSLFSGTSSFVDLFYSDAEKVAINTKALSAQFAALNLLLPETRDQYRTLTESFSKSNNDVFSALVSLAPQMDAYYKALEAQTGANERAAKAAQLSTDTFATMVGFTRAQRYIENGISLPAATAAGGSVASRSSSDAADIRAMLAELRAIAQSVKKTANLLTNVTQDGNSLLTTPA